MNAIAGQVLAPAPLTPIVEYTKTAAALAELRDKHANVVFNVTVPTEMAAARKVRAELRTMRTDLEKLRMQLNEDDQGRIRARNAEAKRLTGEIALLEDPIDEQIKNEESRKERERAERDAAEAARVAAIQARISDIATTAAQAVGKHSQFVADTLADVREIDTDSFEEFGATAAEAKGRAVATLELLHAGTKAKEEAAVAEEQKIAEERRELARLRAAQEQRDREEQARVIETRRLEAEAAAKIEAEQRAHRERLEAEERAARQKRDEEDRIAREAREAAAAKARAEQEAVDAAAAAERAAHAEQERLATVARRQEEARLQAERDRLDAERREVERQQAELLDGASLLKTFVDRFGKRREFAAVTKAITEYLGKQQ